MGEVTNYSFIGSGKVNVRRRGVSAGFRDVGNCTAASVAMEEEQQTLPNFRGGGGNYDAHRQVSGVTFSLTLSDFSPENFELATRGTVTEVSSGSATSEEHTVYLGCLTPLDFLPDLSDTANTLTVTQDPGGTATEMTQGTDYEVTKTGIIPIDGGALSDGDTVGVDYDKRKASTIHALMESARDYEIFIEGLNDAQNGLPVAPHIKRGKFGVPGELAFLGNEYGSMELSGDALVDDQAEADTSPFFDINMARK